MVAAAVVRAQGKQSHLFPELYTSAIYPRAPFRGHHKVEGFRGWQDAFLDLNTRIVSQRRAAAARVVHEDLRRCFLQCAVFSLHHETTEIGDRSGLSLSGLLSHPASLYLSL